jgi:hypothetical protein
MRRRAMVPAAAVIASLGAGAFASAESVDFQIVSHAVQVDQAGQSATFTLTFNQPPNFLTAPGQGQPNSFQYEVDAAWSGPPAGGVDQVISFNHITSVIRGAEVSAGNGLPIRSRDGDGGPAAGGWGPVRDLVTFQVNDEKLTFTADLSDLGDDDGIFRYRVFSTDKGIVTSQANGVAIPLPPALAGGLLTMGGMAIARKFRRRGR